ncbi:MAG: DUF4406 domain-containing protein [Bacteroidales bacterium]|nr:DUF4406 domain-containing protein [Bacteroidales bacterium]
MQTIKKQIKWIKKSVKTRIYISGAITNCPSFKENFARAEKMLRKEGYEVVNLTKADTIMPKSASWDEYGFVLHSS